MSSSIRTAPGGVTAGVFRDIGNPPGNDTTLAVPPPKDQASAPPYWPVSRRTLAVLATVVALFALELEYLKRMFGGLQAVSLTAEDVGGRTPQMAGATGLEPATSGLTGGSVS